MSLQRAYSLVVFKSIDEEQRIIEGIASTPSLDRQGDVMVPEGAQYQLPHPLLLNHDQDRPIGHVLSAIVTAQGIRIRAQVAKGVTPWIDEAWSLIKSGLIRGLSVGARLRDFDRTATGLRVKAWDWLETSAVVIPANQQASILMVKSLDAASLPVSGERSRSLSLNPPGVTGQLTGKAMTISEQLTAARAEQQEQSTRFSELMTQELNESGLTTDDKAEMGTLQKSLETLSARVERLALLEKTMGQQAGTMIPVQAPSRQVEKPKVEVVELEKGIRFARVAMAIAAGKGSMSDSIAFARKWTNTPEVLKCVTQMVTKANEGTSIIESPGWGGELVYTNNVAGELIELLRPATIVGRISGFRPGVFNTRMAVQTGGSTVNWVGETGVKPVTELEFDTITLPYHKIAGIVVLTEELVRLSSPSAEATVRNDLVEQIARFKDAQFISPSVGAGASNPASITNGVASPAASGTDADALYSDMNDALATFDDNNTADLVIVTTPAIARGISTLRNTMGGMEFPTMNPKGGTLMGYPVIVSSSVPSGTMVILNPRDILLADDGRVMLDASNQATLDMSGGSSPTFNLWQRNCVGIRAELWTTWKAVRSAVAVIDTASYGPSGS